MRRPLRPLLLTLVAACSHDATGPADVTLDGGLSVRAESSITSNELIGPFVQVRTIFTNRTGDSVSHDTSPCVVRLRITSVRGGGVVLDEPGSNINYICTPAPVVLASQAADTVYRIVLYYQLGAPKSGDRFHVESVLQTSDGRVSLDAGTVALP